MANRDLQVNLNEQPRYVFTVSYDLYSDLSSNKVSTTIKKTMGTTVPIRVLSLGTFVS